MEVILQQLGFSGLFVVNPFGHSGGLALLWKDADMVNLRSYSAHHIDVNVSISRCPDFRLTASYSFSIVVKGGSLGIFFDLWLKTHRCLSVYMAISMICCLLWRKEGASIILNGYWMVFDMLWWTVNWWVWV